MRPSDGPGAEKTKCLRLQSAAERYEQLSPDDASAMTAEARLRLLSGLKRYFHSKRAEGLLSGKVRVSRGSRVCALHRSNI